MKPAVAYHADDLGHDESANRGIDRALAAGLVRSVSFRVIGAAADEGAAIAQRYRDRVDVGLHFSLTEGCALGGPAEGLTDVLGRFLPLPVLFVSTALGVPHGDSIRRELRAQLRRARELGLVIDHLDGHHHVHVLRGVREVIALEAPSLRVRVPREPPGPSLRGRVVRAVAGAGPDRFAGVALRTAADFGGALDELLAHPPASSFELMVHPRADRPDELRALTDPVSIARIEARCRPCRLSDLPE